MTTSPDRWAPHPHAETVALFRKHTSPEPWRTRALKAESDLHIADCQLTQIRDALTRASGPDAPPCAITVQTIRLIAGEATAPVVIPGHDAHVTEALKALIPSQVGHDSQIDEDIA